MLGTGRQEFSPAEGGLAITTSISNPRCVVSDLSGNFYVCLPGLLIRVDADSGLVRRIAGGETAFGGDGGPAREAVISPQDLVIEEDGNLLIADLEAATVRRIDVATGLIDSVVGNGSRESLGDGGPAFQAGIDPSGLIFDVQGNLYISDLSNHRIRRVDAVTGLIDTLAGGPGTPLVAPRGLAFEGGGDLFVAGQNFLYKIDPESGLIKTVTDNFDDSNDVPLSDFLSQTPSGLTFDGGGNLYFTEFARDRIRRLDAVSQRVTTIADREAGRVGDGRLGSEAILVAPIHLDFDRSGNLYIADLSDNHVRRVSGSTGIISTVAGAVKGGAGAIDDGTPALERALTGARGLAVLPDGQFYVSDQIGIIFFDENQLSFQLARADENLKTPSEADGGPVSEARVEPATLTLDEHQNLYLAEPILNVVRRVDADSKIITTVAGTGQAGYSAEYSLELLFSLDDLSRNPKIFDFLNLQTDIGIYLQLGRIEAAGGLDAPDLQSGQELHLVWTRNALTSRHDFYLNGRHLGTLADSRANFILRGGTSLHFFMDDFVSNQGNASPGRIERLRAYDGVLTPAQVADLFTGSAPPGG